MELYTKMVKDSGSKTVNRNRYDAEVRKTYRQRTEQKEGDAKKEANKSGNFLTKLADMVSLPQQMEQAANMQMYGNENTKKLGELLDTRNEEKIANAKNEISYVAERAAVGAADKLEGLVNAVGYAGQAYNRTQNLQNSQDAAMWGAVTGSDTQKSLSRRLEQTALKSAQEGLKDTVTFGDDLRANVERRHANSNISKMGRVAADVSEAAGGLLPSVAVNLIAPGSGVAANAVNAISAAGNAVQEAKKSGADDLRATGYGLATGGIEFATEKVVDGLSGLFGRGALDDIIEKSVEKYLTNQTARRVVTAAGNAFGEGAEEFISEIGGRLANEWLIDTDDRTFRETLKDGLYSALIGTFISGTTQAGGSIVNAARTNTNTPVSTASQTDYAPCVEQLKQAQWNKKVRDLQDAFQKFLRSEQKTAGTVKSVEQSASASDPETEFKKVLETAASGGKIELSEEMEKYIANKPFDEIEGLQGKLSRRAARRWYLTQNDMIPNKIDRNNSLEQQARAAYELRSKNKRHSRDLMEDIQKRQELDADEPNKSFEELLADKMYRKNLTREQAITDILKTANKTRESVNRKYKLR